MYTENLQYITDYFLMIYPLFCPCSLYQSSFSESAILYPSTTIKHPKIETEKGKREGKAATDMEEILKSSVSCILIIYPVIQISYFCFLFFSFSVWPKSIIQF